VTESSSSSPPEILANFSGANLSKRDLSWADLSGANFSGANLSKRDLSGANLSEANLSKANLSKANLSWANLSEANLSEADLSGANLSEANLSWANLSKADLSEARGLVIAADSLQRLKAAAAAALLPGALEMNSCPTSYCLSGWLISQAGEAGRLLEVAVGPEIAGLMLGGIEAHSHFYDDNEAATKWLQSVLARPEVTQ
jgi:hypothetical protein